jgi:hypothetical protein
MTTASASNILVAALSLVLAACHAPAPPSAAKTVTRQNLLPYEGRILPAGRDLMWLLSADGLFLQDTRSAQRLAVNLPDWQWAAEPYACMPDLALGPKGEVIVTSNVVPKLWRVDAESLAVTVHALELDADNDKDVGFAGLVHSPLHAAYFAVSQLHGSLWMIDSTLQRGRKLALEDLADSSAGIETAFIRAACGSTAPRS